MSDTKTKIEPSGRAAIRSAHDVVRHVREHGAGCVIDVRTPFEVSAEQIKDALHIPLEEIAARVEEVKEIAGDRFLICRSGKRAEIARQALLQAGLDAVIVVDGGLTAYAAAGGATIKGEPRMSLERQVRISAGLLVLVGAVLGFLVHPGLHGISAFVGAGLVFAGVTDYCGMGLLLAKMPWNRIQSATRKG